MSEPQALELRIPRRLLSPNLTRGHHWSRRHKESRTWEFEILAALGRAPVAPWNLVLATETRRDRRGRWRIAEHRRRERRRLTVIRCVPSRRNFCRDEDNLGFTAKPLQHALVRLGLLFDDSRAWLERAIREEVASDGRDATVVRIERLTKEAA